MKNTRRPTASIAMILAITLAACGGGDDSSSNDSTSRYLFYQGSIAAVDSSSPATAISIETGPVSGARAILHATYNASTFSASNLHERTIIYAKEGKLWRVSALKGTGTPAPVQVSSETQANFVCFTSSYSDLANHDNSAYVYVLSGGDGECFTGDDTRKMVKIGMSTTDAPIDLQTKKPVTPLMDFQTGARKGWLATDGINLIRYDANFDNPVQIASFNSEVSNALGGSAVQKKKIFLRIDDKLFAYDTERDSLSGSLYTFTSPFYIPAYVDLNHLYFWENQRIYKLPSDGSASATQLIEENGDGTYTSLRFTTSRLIYTWHDYTQGFTIKSIPKTGGPALTLIPFTPEWLYLHGATLATQENWVYYTRYSPSPHYTPSAGAIKDDGTHGGEKLNAEWIGFTMPTSADINTFQTSARILMAEGYQPSTGFAGGSIKSYAVHSNTVVANMGNIPQDVSGIGFSGLGESILGRGYTGEGKNDIFFINTQKANSLTRVTATQAIDESLIY